MSDVLADLTSRTSGRNKSRRGAQGLALLLLAIAVVALSIMSSRFTTPENLTNLLIQMAPLLFVAVGQTIVILSGGLDVSVGAVVGLATAIVSSILNPVLAVPLVLIAAAAVGLVNGVLVGSLRLHPIVATLATGSVVAGLALLLRPTPGGNVPAFLVSSANERVFGIPVATVWIVAAVVAGWWLLNRTRLGLHIHALGGSADNARLNGINVNRTLISAYVLCAVFSAVGGLLLAGRISSGDALVGMPFTIGSITSVALGGTQFTGGVGGVFGTFAGSLLIGILGNGMNLMNVSPFLQSILNGALLLLAVSFTRRKHYGL